MRKHHPIDAIVPGVRQRILSTILLTPARWWYLSDLARHLDTTPSTLQRELSNLVQAHVLKQRYEGKHTYFKADEECPFFPELRRLFLKTAGLADVLRDAFSPHQNQIQCAFIYGSIAQGEEVSGSDVDLMVVGDVGLSALALPLRRAQELLARPVNPTIFTPAEFKKKIEGRNHFLRNVLPKDKIFVLGDEADLEKLAGRTAGRKTSR